MENLSVRENVQVIGGKWKGHTGVIVGVCNRTDGKAGYKIYREAFGDYIHCLKKFVESVESYLCRWVVVQRIDNVIEQEKAPWQAQSSLRNICPSKVVLVTDEWEEDGIMLVNVVFQGLYAVLPKKDVVPKTNPRWNGLV